MCENETTAPRHGNELCARLFGVLTVAICVLAGTASPSAAAWRQIIDGADSASDNATAVAVDAANNAIMAGTIDNGGGNLVFTVTKFAAATGAELWHQEPGSSAGLAQGPHAVAVDAAGDVFVAGEMDLDFTVVKLSGADGTELWRYQIDGTSTFETFEEVRGIAIDTAGDVVAAGFLNNDGLERDLTVVKLAGATGAELWRREIDGGDAKSDRAMDVGIDSAGDVVAAGRLESATAGFDFTVIKLAQADGAELWRRRIDGDDGGDDEAFTLAIDALDDVVAGGVIHNGATQEDYAVVKLAGATGAEVWRHEVEGGGGTGAFTEERVTNVAVDASGDVLAAGALEYFLRAQEFVVMKLAGASGAELWRREINGAMLGAQDFALALTVDAAGDAIAAGRIENGPRDDFDFSVFKLAGTTGASIWEQHVDGTSRIGVSLEESVAVVLDSAGDVVAAGVVENHRVSQDQTVIKFDGASGVVGPLRGARLQMRDRAGQPDKRRLKFTIDESTIVVPLPGSPDDPTTAGAELRILNPVTLESATFTLPPGSNWQVATNALGFNGYVYRDRGTNGPCELVQARPRELVTAVCSGRSGLIPFSLDEPSQGTLIVSIAFGTAGRQCATFGGRISRDFGTGSGNALFKAADADAVLGEACP